MNTFGSDYVLNYLNFADFELNNSDKESTDSLFEKRNMDGQQAINYFNDYMLNNNNSGANTPKNGENLNETENCFNMGVELTNTSTTIDKSEDLKVKEKNCQMNFESPE